MTTQYTPILQLALPVTGELTGTWGDMVNNSITSMIEEAIAGMATINTWAGSPPSHTLTTVNGLTDEARCAMLLFSGAPGAAAQVICPGETKVYIVTNNVSGGYDVTIKTASGTGISVPNGNSALVYCDGTNVFEADSVVRTFSSGTTGLTPNTATNGTVVLGGTLAVAHGGTGVTTSTGSGGVVLSTSPTLVTPVLGTPTSINLTNATDLPLATGVTGTLSVANGGTGVTTATGSGSVVRATGPTISTATITSSTLTGAKETSVAVSGTSIDLTQGNYFTRTISGSTTLSVTNVPPAGTVASFILNITNAGTNVTWWSGVKWSYGLTPTLTTSGRDVLGFFTYDGGTTWTGLVLARDVK